MPETEGEGAGNGSRGGSSVRSARVFNTSVGMGQSGRIDDLHGQLFAL